ncbi:MAG: FAD-dependent oxidoreductase [Patescibacteria group bacterium]
MKLILDHTTQEAPDVTSFYFKSETPITWRAGQFLVYTLPHPNEDDRKDQRYFTIASPPDTKMPMITTRFTDPKGSTFKSALHALSQGDTIEAKGPDGEFVLDDPAQPSIFIAGGIGVTPYHSILLDLDHRGLPINVTLLYANRTEDAVYRKELEALSAKHPEFKIHYFIGDQRIDEQAIRKIVPDLTVPLFYISGPEPMVQAFEKMLMGMGIPDAHIKRDYFPGYNWP